MKLRLGIAVAVVMLASLSSCSLPFYWQAVSGQVELIRKRAPIDEVLEDPAAGDDVKAALRRVAQIRVFATESLGLPDNKSYTTYADLGRPYVVWNVVAAPEFAIEPRQWCFPFAGCVSYRGFFDRDKALAYAQKLGDEGLDTYVGGANAYSTLGYFADPVLNTMLTGDETAIAALLFHELAHQKLYFKGDSELSEAFASAIEEYGTRCWLAAHGDEEGLAAYVDRLAERGAFAELVVASRARLADLYAATATAPESDRRLEKERAFATLRDEYARAKQAGRMSNLYDAWFAQPLNNAVLASVATYRQWVPALHWRLATVGLAQFYSDLEALQALDEPVRDARLVEWDRAASAAGRPAVPCEAGLMVPELGKDRRQVARRDAEAR
jgi:predicted aminopeptidase